jgi:hypothetical protein
LNRDLTASTVGQLAENFVEKTETNHGVESKSYEVSYTFQANGVDYHGTDTISAEPEDSRRTVYYDAANPDVNALTNHPVNTSSTTLAMVFIGICAVGYALLPVWLKESMPPSVAQGANGDAAGEHLIMSTGKYAAGHYTVMGFGVVLAGSTYFASTALLHLVGSHISHDFIVLFVSFTCSIVTIGLFWDRFKCNTAFCSNYCSGCANLSIVYLPILSAIYGIWRGFRKLGGR